MLLNTRIPPVYILGKIKYPLMYVALLSIVLFIVTTALQKQLPEMPLSIPAFIGTSISVLLSFKLSQAYDRWWEARKIWGCIVNDSRSLVLQLQHLIIHEDAETVRRMGLRQIAWSYALGRALRGQKPMDEGTEQLLSPQEIAEISLHQNQPLAMLQQHTRDLKALREKGSIDQFAHIQLDSTLVRLCDSQGKAERIKSTVFPVTYRLFLHFMIYIFVVTLSISLRNVVWYFETPLLLIISMTFFLLEKSAAHMQEPFENRPTDTAVTAIARNIDINIRQLLGEKDVPEPITPYLFYIK